MKKIQFLGCVLLCGFFLSCASRRAAVITPPTTVEPVAVPMEIESAIRLIRENSPEIRKYFLLGENGDILTRGDIEQFVVTYDLKELKADGSGGFLVPFSVKSPSSGEIRHDNLSWKPRKDVTGILLAFDDTFQDVWESNFDLFDRYRARATFFVQGVYEEYSAFCAEALKRGHDVGYHSINHLDLRKVSAEVLQEEALSQVQAFRNAGVPLTSFAYPFGFSDAWMHEDLLDSYKILRGYGVTFRVYSSGVIRQGHISSRALDTVLFKRDEDFEAVINLMLRTIKFIGGDLILPLTSHDISDTAAWGITPYRLEYLLQTVNDLQLNYYRYRDFS